MGRAIFDFSAKIGLKSAKNVIFCIHWLPIPPAPLDMLLDRAYVNVDAEETMRVIMTCNQLPVMTYDILNMLNVVLVV